MKSQPNSRRRFKWLVNLTMTNLFKLPTPADFPSSIDLVCVFSDCSRIVMTSGNRVFLQIIDQREFEWIVNGNPTACVWLSEDVACLGFDTGDILCVKVDGCIVFECLYLDAAVQALRVSRKGIGGQEDISLWILFDGGLLFSVPFTHIFGVDKEVTSITKFKLVDYPEVNDFLVLPFTQTFSTYENEVVGTHSVIISGYQPTLSVYNICPETTDQEFGKLTGYVKSKVGGMLSKTFFSFFNSGVTETQATSNEQPAGYIPLRPVINFEDEKRRILRLSIDPSGKFVAGADGLARVLLFDRRTARVIRLWKGVRDATMAWIECALKNDSIASTSHTKIVLCLAIYAPKIGILQIYKMAHGPCLRTIPVGLSCKVCTVFGSSCRPNALADSASSALGYEHECMDGNRDYANHEFAKCGLIRFSSTSIDIKLVDPYEISTSDVEEADLNREFQLPMEKLEIRDIKHEAVNVPEHEKLLSAKRILDDCGKKKRVSVDDEATLKSVISMITSFEALDEVLYLVSFYECTTNWIGGENLGLGVASIKRDSEEARFSVGFHKLLLQRCQEVLHEVERVEKNVESQNSRFYSDKVRRSDLLKREIYLRSLLIPAYEGLCELSTGSTYNSSFTEEDSRLMSLDSLPTDVQSIMKINSGRAEAVSWMIRCVRKKFAAEQCFSNFVSIAGFSYLSFSILFSCRFR